MKLAVISDVHANLEALTAVMRDIEKQKVERIFFLGDAVGYGADPNKCVKIINSMCEIKLLGNHDYVAMGLESSRHFNPMAQKSIQWTQDELSSKTIEMLSDFEMESTFLDYHLVHSTPDNPTEWNYILTPEEALHNFDYFSQNYCIIGHSHLPSVFSLTPDKTVKMAEGNDSFTADKENRYIINTGSVGQPRDGNKDACYLIIETDSETFEFIRVAYDLETAQKKMQKAQLPEYLITRLANGK
ncbi:MAG: metallophosphoesterase family protein [candidate division Zixibacteria bacterium]|nr:metallophosphoesterase family protein [candidate division Zixibacteria bacterium]